MVYYQCHIGTGSTSSKLIIGTPSIGTVANGLNYTQSNAELGNITPPELHTEVMKA